MGGITTPPMPGESDRTSARKKPLSFYAFDETIFEVCWHEPPAAAGHVPEALVQDVWRLLQFRTGDLKTTDGRSVEIFDPGRLNRDSGPDFLDARMRIDGDPADGPVEIHTASALWYDHGHHLDAAYAGVSLHVSLEHDLWTGRVKTSTGRLLPEIVLAPLLHAPVRTLLYNYHARSQSTLPCAGRWSSVEPELIARWIDQLASVRLREKVRLLESRYLERPNLDQLLYELVLTGLGYAKNSLPMLELARRLPLGLLHRLDTREEVQAAMLGTAGLLPDPAVLGGLDRPDVDHVMYLRDLFARFQSSTGIESMNPLAWQFFRLRPSNFPTLRLAQAAALVCRSCDGPLSPTGHAALRASIASDRQRAALESLFRVDPGPFWHDHVRLDRRARRGFPFIGAQRLHAIFLNAIAPVLQLRAAMESDERLAADVTAILRLLPPEDDEITRMFAVIGTSASSGLEAQGLHQLYRQYCREGRCLSCEIGRSLFGRNRPTNAERTTSGEFTSTRGAEGIASLM